MGTVGDALDNAVIEAFWTRMQVELLNRKKWRTRVELGASMKASDKGARKTDANTAKKSEPE